MQVHSVVDVITNSSSEIYTFAHKNSVSKTKEMIAEILRIAGMCSSLEEAKEKVDVLFDVKVTLDYEWYDEDSESGDCRKKVIATSDEQLRKGLHEISNHLDESMLTDMHTEVTISDKAGNEIDLTKLIGNIVYQQEVSTG